MKMIVAHHVSKDDYKAVEETLGHEEVVKAIKKDLAVAAAEAILQEMPIELKENGDFYDCSIFFYAQTPEQWDKVHEGLKLMKENI